MPGIQRQIRFFRSHIPAFECVPGCHDCCGPVLAPAAEVAELPVKDAGSHAAALDELRCPYLGARGCEVYLDRPLICRLFGTTSRLPCPNGCGPSQPLSPEIEAGIDQLLSKQRKVLL